LVTHRNIHATSHNNTPPYSNAIATIAASLFVMVAPPFFPEHLKNGEQKDRPNEQKEHADCPAKPVQESDRFAGIHHRIIHMPTPTSANQIAMTTTRTTSSPKHPPATCSSSVIVGPWSTFSLIHVSTLSHTLLPRPVTCATAVEILTLPLRWRA